MSTETSTGTAFDASGADWLGGGVAGFLAAVPFGLMVQFLLGAMGTIGALYGMPGLVTGWVAHLFHGTVFGLAFAALTDADALSGYAEDYVSSAGLGLVYGAVLWVVFIVFVWPVWLGAVGFPPGPKALPVPYVAAKPLVGHLVYGAVLGALYPWISGW